MVSPLSEYRTLTRSLIGRLEQHCAQIGIRPPRGALARYASLRYVEACWWLSGKMSDARADDLDYLAHRLRLDVLGKGTPMCLPDLSDAVVNDFSARVCAPWAGQALMVSARDL